MLTQKQKDIIFDKSLLMSQLSTGMISILEEEGLSAAKRLQLIDDELRKIEKCIIAIRLLRPERNHIHISRPKPAQ